MATPYCVVDAPGGVDVTWISFSGSSVPEQQLRDDQVATMSSMAVPDENDVVLEEAGVDVVGALAPGRLFHEPNGNNVPEYTALIRVPSLAWP